MIKIYKIFKITLLSLIIIGFAGILIYETTRESNPDLENNPVIQNISVVYDGIKGFMLDDPYHQNILTGVEAEKIDFKNQITGIITEFSNLIKNKNFYNSTFVYMFSKKMEGLDTLLKDSFSNYPAFKDLIMIDKEKNIIYKYGNSSFIADYYHLTNAVEVRFFDQNLGLLQVYQDTNTDFETLMIALFDLPELAKPLEKAEFPSFVVLNGLIFPKNISLPSNIRNVLENPKSQKKYYGGLKVLETEPIFLNKTLIATLAIQYPARSIGSTFLMLLKFIGLIFLILLIFLADRWAEEHMRQMGTRTMPKKPKKTLEEDEETNTENLEWVEKYIKNNEDKKE